MIGSNDVKRTPLPSDAATEMCSSKHDDDYTGIEPAIDYDNSADYSLTSNGGAHVSSGWRVHTNCFVHSEPSGEHSVDFLNM
jgi:hypothetical protein